MGADGRSGVWLSGRALASHARCPGFDPRHLQCSMHTTSRPVKLVGGVTGGDVGFSYCQPHFIPPSSLTSNNKSPVRLQFIDHL